MMHFKDFPEFLNNLSSKPLCVLDASIPFDKFTSINLSKTNIKLHAVNVSSSMALGQYIDNYIEKEEALVAYGGYLEVRNIYNRSQHFNKDTRNIHLGMDLWCNAETPVLAPLNGTVHSFKNNTQFGDYGPTIILKHAIEGVEFYTLYGHLSLKSIANLQVGEWVKQGEQLATLGDASVNGDYPPHLHFQIIKDIENYYGDYPGVCSKADLEFYKTNCPNPNFLLKLY